MNPIDRMRSSPTPVVEAASPPTGQQPACCTLTAHVSSTPPLSLVQSGRAARALPEPRTLLPAPCLPHRLAKLVLTFTKDQNEQDLAIRPNQLTMARNQMRLEGGLLQLNPLLPYSELSNHLPGRPTLLGGMHIDAGFALLAAVDKLVDDPSSSALPDQRVVNELVATFTKGLASHLDGTHALYEAVLKGPDLKNADRPDVERSRAAFIKYSRQIVEVVPQAFQMAISKLDSSIIQLQKNVDSLRGAQGGSLELVESELREHERAKKFLLNTLASQSKLEAFKGIVDTLNLIDLEPRIANLNELRAKSGGLGQMANASAEGIGAFLASYIALGMGRTLLAQNVDLSLVPKAMVVGMGTGSLHELSTHSLKPIGERLAAWIGMNPPIPVSIENFLPAPSRSVLRQGQLAWKTDEEFRKDLDVVEQERAKMRISQSDSAAGTPGGDSKGYLAFMVAHGLRQIMADCLNFNGQSIFSIALASGVGGYLMATSQTFSKLNTNYKDLNGRCIPAFTPRTAPDSNSRAKMQTNNDLRNLAVRTNHYSKWFSTAVGVLAAGGIPKAEKAISRQDMARNFALTALASLVFLIFHFSNGRAGAEAKAGRRFQNALDNVTDPDRQKLPHSTVPGSRGRQIENGFHRLRGAAQLVPQGLTVLASKADDAAGGVVSLATNRLQQKIRVLASGARSSRAVQSESNELNDLERGAESPETVEPR